MRWIVCTGTSTIWRQKTRGARSLGYVVYAVSIASSRPVKGQEVTLKQRKVEFVVVKEEGEEEEGFGGGKI
jgi:hypothetical protein